MDSLFHFTQFFPYGIPPFLTMMVCLFLVALTYQEGRAKRENTAFTIFCFLQALLSFEIIISTVVSSAALVLKISRMIQIFYVFIIPVGIGFVHETAGIWSNGN